MITSWSGATVDTKRNRLLFMGDGHDGAYDNAVYSVDLVTLSSSTATCGGLTCITTSNGGSIPAVTRLNDPSVYIPGCPEADNPDGAPRAMQTYGGLIYLPHSDKMFHAGYGNMCGAPAENHTWMLDLPTMIWTQKSAAPYSAGAGRLCVLDTTAPDDQVLCISPNTSLWRYVVNTDTWINLANGVWTLQSGIGGTPVLDPDRRMIYAIGPNYDGTGPKIWSISLNTPTSATDITSSTTGCGDLMAYPNPSVVWDPSLHRIVGYVPITVAGGTAANNEIVIFDPATRSCVVQPQLGGSGPAAHSSIRAGQGMFGRFAYVPGIGKYVLVNNNNLDVYTFAINANNVPGLGASTLTCVDRDGDGYGAGPGCLGPDADDQDAGVHTSAQFLAKWGTMTAGLQHLGYKPANIWYVAATGSNSGSPPKCKNNASAPCADAGYIASSMVPGDVVLLRGGTYSWMVNGAPTGISGLPIVYMSYPGELATFTPYPSGIDISSAAFYVLDGIKYVNNGSNACVNFTFVSHAIVRHLDTSQCEWGMDSELPQDLTIEDSISYGNSQHGIYLTNHPGPGSGAPIYGQVFVRRNILYNNSYSGNQLNGPFQYSVIEQNIAYNNGDASGGMGFSWLTGVSNTVFRSNVSINNGTGLSIIQYQAYCTVYPHTPCPYGQTGNLIENFTHYATGMDRNGVAFGGGFAAVAVGNNQGDPPTTPAAMGNNTFRNLNIVNFHTAGYGYAPLTDYDGTNFPTTTFDHLNLYNASSPAGTAAFTVGSKYYTCAQAAAAPAVFGSIAGCNYADPLFVAASISYNNTPTSFNLQLQSTSPALYAGTATLAPAYDVRGNPFANPPSLGAYEMTGIAPPPPSCDVNRDGVVNSLDWLASVNQVLGLNACGTADLMQIGQCNVVDVQRVINAISGGACLTGH